MRILYVLQDEFEKNKGGMATQMRQYMKGISERGFIVDRVSVSEFENGTKETYEIIHLCDISVPFDLQKMLNGLRKIDRKKSKIVLSTIYWDFEDYFRNGAYPIQRWIYKLFGASFVERVSSLIKFLKTKEKRYFEGFLSDKKSLQRKLGSEVDLLLPNSQGEGELFKRITNATSDFKVINNGVSLRKSNADKERDIDILCVARIDRRKNQLQIAREFKGSKYKVKFAGPIGPNSKTYFKQLKKIIDKNQNFEYLGIKTQEELDELYSRSKYHCLLSWVETPGLVNLDAFSQGCEVIVADKGSVREYLGSSAFYVEIGKNRGELLEIVRSNKKKSENKREELMEKIRNEYNWTIICDKLCETYMHLWSI